jgi:anti-sigma factor ChrR (cupin superfamily)
MPTGKTDLSEMDLSEHEQRLATSALHALGALAPEEAQRFAATMHANPVLIDEWKAFEAVVTDLALGAAEAAPSSQVREKLLARVATLPQEAHDTALPHSIRLAEGEWCTLAPHVSAKVLHHDHQTGLVTSLIRLEPGGYLPRHRHLGLEQTLVVEGDCRVNDEIFYPGDFRLRPAQTEDGEVTTEHGTTILLIAPACFENLDPHWPIC